MRLSSPVRSIVTEGEWAVVAGAWGAVAAARVVVAVPPAVIPRISFAPALSGRRAHLHAKMPPGYVIKCMARYERPFWRERGLSGQAGSPDRPLAITFDNSPADASCGVLLGFLEGGHGRRAGALPAGDRRDLVLGDLAAYFGPEAAAPLEYVEQDWADVEWIRGGYGAHLAPGTWTDYGSLLREPEGLVHWAGVGDERGLERLHGRGGAIGRARRRRDRRARNARMSRAEPRGSRPDRRVPSRRGHRRRVAAACGDRRDGLGQRPQRGRLRGFWATELTVGPAASRSPRTCVTG